LQKDKKMATIKLFRDTNFQNENYTYHSETSYVGNHFNDKTSSIIVEEGNWIIYQDAYYGGDSYVLTPGEYPNPASWKGRDNEISSIKPFFTNVNLFPHFDLLKDHKKTIELSKEMDDFNKNLDFTYLITNLTGRAREIAFHIQNDLVPKIKSHGDKIRNELNYLKGIIKRLTQSMIRFCYHIQRQLNASNTNEIKSILTNVRVQIEKIEKEIKKRLTPNLDQYHLDINQLISDLASDKIAIEQSNEELKKEREEVLAKMRNRTHTVCGVIKMIWDAVTFQLQDELNQENEELARIRFHYQCNTMAMGGAKKTIQTIKDFRGQIEKQTKHWTYYKASVDSLSSDIHELLENSNDADMWSMYIDMIRMDWEALGKM
jgi:hypothetical protein